MSNQETAVGGTAETLTVAAETEVHAGIRNDARTEGGVQQAPSQNVGYMQRKVAGVLRVRVMCGAPEPPTGSSGHWS